MRKQIVVVPGISQTQGRPHAVMVDDTLYGGGRAPVDVSGNLVGRGNMAVQIDKVYRDTEAILRAAGLSFENAMKLNFYVHGLPNNYRLLQEVRERYLPDVRWASTGVQCDLPDPQWLYVMEAVAGTGRETVVSPQVCCAPVRPRFAPTPRSAHAVKVGDVFYVQGQVAWDLNGDPVGQDDIDVQARYCYMVLDHIVKTVGRDPKDLVKGVTFLKRREDFEKMEEVRATYLPPSQWAASTVLASMVGAEYLLEPELIVATGPKSIITSREVSASARSAPAIKVGSTIYTGGLGGLGSLDARGGLPGKITIEAQTEQVCRNLEAVLRAAGASWDDVVKMNTQVARRQDYSKVVAIRDTYLPRRTAVVTDVIADLPDPDLLVQAECVAVV
jgi:2-iminobutanoate/2-iminopropanoate deaminase